MEHTFRCNCPISSALDILGDKWSLVLIKQMLFEGKHSFKDFSESEESIASNILSSRLKMLEDFEIISKSKHPTNRKTNIYTLNEKGIALTPVLMELTLWSKYNISEIHPELNLDKDLNKAEKNKERAYRQIVENYKEFKQELLKS